MSILAAYYSKSVRALPDCFKEIDDELPTIDEKVPIVVSYGKFVERGALYNIVTRGKKRRQAPVLI